MDLNKIAVFAIAKKRLGWLTQRQEVLAQNIANADTPNYKARDLEKFEFQRLIRRESAQLNMVSTHESHEGGRRKRIRDFTEEKDRKPYETTPSGNSVVLEEQMGKINNTSASHKLTTKLYTKQLAMIRTALGK
ncbi:MAG: flagellar basal body rod protein FlgB [Rhodospirillales bacterium]|nr:flagellar basal body rod protein FlgB [Rhodospirillales bacterium]